MESTLSPGAYLLMFGTPIVTVLIALWYYFDWGKDPDEE